MSKVFITDSNFTSIANSIRTKLGVQTTYKPSEMSSAIDSIPAGLEEEYKKLVEGGATSITLPDNITKIKPYAFYSYDSSGGGPLQNVNMPNTVTEIGKGAFQGDTHLALTSLPSGLTSIAQDAFYQCTSLAITSFPSGLLGIGSMAFRQCNALTSLTFLGTPNGIASSAFYSCANITTIRVPWASGAVSGAPWGATNATITYGYTA